MRNNGPNNQSTNLRQNKTWVQIEKKYGREVSKQCESEPDYICAIAAMVEAALQQNKNGQKKVKRRVDKQVAMSDKQNDGGNGHVEVKRVVYDNWEDDPEANEDTESNNIPLTSHEYKNKLPNKCEINMYLDKCAKMAASTSMPDGMDCTIHLPRWRGMKNIVAIELKWFLLCMCALIPWELTKEMGGNEYSWALNRRPLGWKYICDEKFLTDKEVRKQHEHEIITAKRKLNMKLEG